MFWECPTIFAFWSDVFELLKLCLSHKPILYAPGVILYHKLLAHGRHIVQIQNPFILVCIYTFGSYQCKVWNVILHCGAAERDET